MNYRKKKTDTKDIKTKRRHTERETGPPVVSVDYEYYARYLCAFDISEAQKHELMSAFANIMMSFVDLGFGIAPGQITAEKSCEKDRILADFLSENAENLLGSDEQSETKNDKDARTLCAAEEDDS